MSHPAWLGATLSLLFFSLSASAQEANYVSERLDTHRGISILTEELDRIDGSTRTVGGMMMGWINRSESEAGLCGQFQVHLDPMRLMCIRHDLSQLTRLALKQKKIDEVEDSNLRKYLSHLTLRKGSLAFLPIKTGLWTRFLEKRAKKVIIPTLSDYATKANVLKSRRIRQGQPGELDPETLSLLGSSLYRKMAGLGKVTPDQYILSKYSLAQISAMSGLILETTRWTDQKVTAEIVLDRTGLLKKKSELNGLQSEFVRAVETGKSSSELDSLTVRIETLKKEIELIDNESKIQQLNDDRYQAALALAREKNDNAEELNQLIQDLTDQIDSLQDQLEQEKIVIPLDPSDVHRLAMNHLEGQLEMERRKPGAALSQFNGTLADLLVAAYLTGDIDGAELKAMLSIPDFKEHRESTLLKAGKILWVAGRMYLMLNPYTVIPTTLVSVTVSAFQKKKQYEKELAEKTHLIRQ